MPIEINKVYNVDYKELLKEIPDNYIDLVLTDPPYGDGVGYGRNNKTIVNNDGVGINYEFIDLIYPKMKDNTSLYLFSNHKFECNIKNYVANNSKLKYVSTIIIVKNNIGMGYPFRNQYEVCLVFEKGNPNYNLKSFSTVLKMKHINHSDLSHPHKKHDDILRKILFHSSKEGDLVFDAFMGSFSTAIACHKEKRNFLGSEIDEKWYKNGQLLLNSEMNQGRLDFPV